MMQVPEVGPLLRALLPVHLSGGYTLTFGLWLLVRPDDLQRAFRLVVTGIRALQDRRLMGKPRLRNRGRGSRD